ncbi:MAG: AAA family ATPase [Acidobacteria bacterium]|nr:AAA family ATPase [Acidobacteriota bacterium]
MEWPDVVREARLYIEKQGLDPGYRCVLADEVQDFTAGELKLLRRLSPEGPNSLFLVGDAHQRICGHPLRLLGCGIDIRGRSRRLKLNYRTTEEIARRATALLEGREIDDLDGGVDTLRGYRSLRSGVAPELRHFEREAEESEFIVRRVRE